MSKEIKELCNSIKCLTIEDKIDKIYHYIRKSQYFPKLKLLDNREVLDWCFEKLPESFKDFEEKNKTSDEKKLKINEDIWGKNIIKKYYPDINKQWTNKFGEFLAEDIYLLKNLPTQKPPIKEGLHPDLECEECIIEVKIGTYFTRGTAHEKILGCPIKYRNVYILYKKPLKILCIGRAEKEMVDNYKLINPEDENGKKLVEFYKKELNIEYVTMKDLLLSLII